jgi:TetR/AcrR family transcriptional regulator
MPKAPKLESQASNLTPPQRDSGSVSSTAVASETAPEKASKRRDAATTRAKILAAAIEAFAEKGLDASIEDVADAAGANRRMAYYYFGSKEGLYTAALEATFLELAKLEASIDVEALDPFQAIDALVSAKFEHFLKHPRYIDFLKIENLSHARYFNRSERLREMRGPLINLIKRVLEKGQRMKVMRSDVDPLELYIAISALAYFAFSNQYTLTASLGVDVTAPTAVERRRRMTVDMVTAFLRNNSRQGPTSAALMPLKAVGANSRRPKSKGNR